LGEESERLPGCLGKGLPKNVSGKKEAGLGEKGAVAVKQINMLSEKPQGIA